MKAKYLHNNKCITLSLMIFSASSLPVFIVMISQEKVVNSSNNIFITMSLIILMSTSFPVFFILTISQERVVNSSNRHNVNAILYALVNKSVCTHAYKAHKLDSGRVLVI